MYTSLFTVGNSSSQRETVQTLAFTQKHFQQQPAATVWGLYKARRRICPPGKPSAKLAPDASVCHPSAALNCLRDGDLDIGDPDTRFATSSLRMPEREVNVIERADLKHDVIGDLTATVVANDPTVLGPPRARD
jgi:hypothetical protein